MFKKSRFSQPRFREKVREARNFKRADADATSSLKSRFAAVLVALGLILGFYYLVFSATFLVRSAAIAGGLKKEQIEDILRQMAERGAAVFLSTHILEIAERMCDRIGIINKGELVAVGTMDELRSLGKAGEGEASSGRDTCPASGSPRRSSFRGGKEWHEAGQDDNYAVVVARSSLRRDRADAGGRGDHQGSPRGGE